MKLGLRDRVPKVLIVFPFCMAMLILRERSLRLPVRPLFFYTSFCRKKGHSDLMNHVLNSEGSEYAIEAEVLAF